MKLVPLILILLGGGVMLYGGGLAANELYGLYAGALTDPMADPAGGEAGVQDRMLRGAAIGAAGAVPFVIGWVTFRIAAIRSRRRRGTL
jgi:hypothetical protein